MLVHLVQFCLQVPDEAQSCLASDGDSGARHPMLVFLPGSVTSVVAGADAGRGSRVEVAAHVMYHAY